MKLEIELVPETCWFSNVRSAVSKKEWDLIKKRVSDKAYAVCEICGGTGPKHPVECHEIWSYDDKKLIQKLEGMIALCPNCHGVKHYGYSQMRGKGEQMFLHFMKINELTSEQAAKEIKKAFVTWGERSKKEWVLDISLLKDYGIDVSKFV